jgi:hypothetical protein
VTTPLPTAFPPKVGETLTYAVETQSTMGDMTADTQLTLKQILLVKLGDCSFDAMIFERVWDRTFFDSSIVRNLEQVTNIPDLAWLTALYPDELHGVIVRALGAGDAVLSTLDNL